VSDREEEVTRKERSLVKKKEHLDRKEEAVTALHDKLKAYNAVLEKQRDKQAAAEAKLQQELADKASDIARAEGNLKAREASLVKRTTDLTWQEEDLAFREEMWARRNKLLDELELEAEEKGKRLEGKVWTLEEQVRQFQAAHATQTAPGSQAVEVMRKTLDDLRAEQHAGAQRIAAWAGEASTTLVPLGMSPIPALVRSASISDALPILDSAADRLRRLDQILGARLEAEGSRLCRRPLSTS
jgi:chromosome segregation ATPase